MKIDTCLLQLVFRDVTKRVIVINDTILEVPFRAILSNDQLVIDFCYKERSNLFIPILGHPVVINGTRYVYSIIQQSDNVEAILLDKE